MEYHNLITKFFAGEISDAELAQLRSWLDNNPENQRIFDHENELWQELDFHTNILHYNSNSAWLNVSSRLGLGKNPKASFMFIKRVNYRMFMSAAALACIIAIGSLCLWITGDYNSSPVAVASTTVSTNEGERAHIFLPDSTEIILNSSSTVQYDANYNGKDRVVKFSGEAFFDVRTNPEKPFVVILDKMEISATGTKFNIFSFDNESRVETTLEEGKIQVTINGKEPINLTSGQQVVYFVKTNKSLVSEVNTDTYTSWIENKLRLDDTPFEEALRRIGRKYNVRFEITDRDLLDLSYTATFIDESVEEVMQMLKDVSPINYKIYNLTSINDKQYRKPRIVVGKKKNL